MVVVDHDTGRLVWVAEGHDRKTLQKFFDLLGTERANNIKLVSADAAEWIGDCAMANCVNAQLCLDPFHIVRWATNALDVVRHDIWNTLRKTGLKGEAAHLKGCRYALWKNDGTLTERQQTKLAWIAEHNKGLYSAYLLKEQLRLVFAHRGETAIRMLDDWLVWARRCRIPAFMKLYHRIKHHRTGIIASAVHGLSNGLTENCQHQDPAPHPHRLRLPQHRQPHRSLPPPPRRTLPTPTRPKHADPDASGGRRAVPPVFVESGPPASGTLRSHRLTDSPVPTLDACRHAVASSGPLLEGDP